MADPFSIIAGSVGIADVCVRLGYNIYHLKQEVGGVQEELDVLAQEVDRVRELCGTVGDTFNERLSELSSNPSEHPDTAKGLWTHLGTTLKQCLEIVIKLDGVVQKVRGQSAASGPSKLDAVTKVLRKKLCESDLRECRAQLVTHQNTLQLVLTTITLKDMGTSQACNAQSLGDISKYIQKLNDNLQSRMAHLPQSVEPDDNIDHGAAVSVTVDSLATPPAPSNHHFDIPQSVSSIFTGREAFLQRLRQILVHDTTQDNFQRRFVIYGLGGSGKTQFCCKFAQQNRDSFWGVFWIDASTQERAKQSLEGIAETAGLPKNENSALHWLSNLGEEWLLLIDNADDEGVPLERYFPRGNRGNILVTTRNPALKMHGNIGPKFYHFRGLTLEEAVQLLLKASDEPKPWNSACEASASNITEALGYLALAIVHAGAAIRDQLCSLKDYLDYYRRSRRRIRNVKQEEGNSASQTAVYATWDICYDRLEQKGNQAALDALEMLNILAFFHWEAISQRTFTRALRNLEQQVSQEVESPKGPSARRFSSAAWAQRLRKLRASVLAFMLKNRSRTMLPSMMRITPQQGAVDDAEDRVRHALKELVQMSLILRNDHTDTYSMHPLVHTWARERPRMRLSDQALWADAAGRVLAASVLLPPLGATDADERYHISLLPHVKHIQACRAAAAEGLSAARLSINPVWHRIVRLLSAMRPDSGEMQMYAKFSLVFAQAGRWENAEELLKEVTDFLCRYLGPEDERSRRALLFLATAYWHMGRAVDAAEIQNSVLETCVSHLGENHADTLRTMAKLGHTRWQQGRYSAARVLQEKALAGLLQELPRDHPDTLDAMDNLGRTVQKFWGKHDLEKALRLHSDAAEGMARVHGYDHERTLIARENFCRVAALLGGAHLTSASDLMARVLETRQAKLGKEHPYTLLAMVNMAIVLSATGKQAEAEGLVRQGLPVADRTLGQDHIGTLFGQHTLACILVQRGQYVEAEELLVHVTERQKHMGSHRGDYHPDRLGALIELARCCFLQGKMDRSLAVCDEAIHGLDYVSIDAHPLAISLRKVRPRLAQLAQDGLSGCNQHQDSISFPFVLFYVCDEVSSGAVVGSSMSEKA